MRGSLNDEETAQPGAGLSAAAKDRSLADERGGWPGGGHREADGREPPWWAQARVAAMDALASAAVAAAGARAEAELQARIAASLGGRFADWVIVDLIGSGHPRAVAARRPDPALADALSHVPLNSCPLITSAVRRRTPVVRAPIDDESLLGSLPDGRLVTGSLAACSAAVGPIVVGGTSLGAITIARGAGGRHIGFVELGALGHIAALTAAAIERLGGGG
jgi:GAF domain-containing protein